MLLFALQLAFGIWGPNAVSDLLTALIAWLPRAFVAIIIIVVAAAIAGAAHDLITNALGGLAYGRLLARAASILIIALGVIAALDQIRIATSVTQPLLIAVLATVAGVVIVGVGGGLIRPMQHRWEGWLDRAREESAAIRAHARTYADEKARIAAQAEATRLREAEEARAAEEAGKAEEARRAEEARAAEEARKAEEARLAQEARVAAEARQAEEARVAQEARQAEETRRAEERATAEQARAAELARRADEVRAAEEVGKAELAGQADVSRQAREARAAAESAPADETQVIAVQVPVPQRRPGPVDDRPHLIPGFDRDDGPETSTEVTDPDATMVVSDPDATSVISVSDEAERTQALPRLTDQTAVDDIPPVPADDAPKAPFRRRGR